MPFRGDYWQLRPSGRHLARNLIYPVPDPKFPFLGVHFTRRIGDDAVWLGPERGAGPGARGLPPLGPPGRRPRPDPALPGVPADGAQVLADRAAEVYRDFPSGRSSRPASGFVPELEPTDVMPGPSGVRAQSVARDGGLVDDFVFNIQGRQLMHVRNAPSPAATSSLAIGELIADEWDRAS